MSEKEQEWEVERIIQRGKFNSVTHYLVKWKGFPIQEATWEPITNLAECKEAIFDFEHILNKINSEENKKKPPKKRVNFKNIYKKNEKDVEKNLKTQAQNYYSKSEENHEGESQCLVVNKSLNLRNIQKNQANVDLQFIPQNRPKYNFLEENQENQDEKLNMNRRKRLHLNFEGQNPKDQQCEFPSKKLKPNELIQVDNQQPKISNIVQCQHQNQQKNQQKQETQKSQIKQIEQNYDQKALKNEVIIEQTSISMINHAKTGYQCFEKLSNLPQKQSIHQKNQYREQKQKSISIKQNKMVSLPKIIPNQQRYRFLDSEYERQQKMMLFNVIRRMYGKQKLKSKINIVDLSRNQKLLEGLAGVKIIENQTTMEKLDLFIKLEYGWSAIGKHHQHGFAMLDVNLIDDNCWRLFSEIIIKQKYIEK